ncbi:MAG: hypothetical protein ACREGR_03755 [Minisyncoccia bacterium]
MTRAILGITFTLAAIVVLIWLAAPKPSVRHLPADAYPLYPGASWGPEEATNEQGATDYTINSAPFSGISDIASVTMPFMSYYDQKLTTAGWNVDTAREAGGPGGESMPYVKNGQELIVSYSTDFKIKPANAPEECPCDTTLTLESVGP